MLDEFPEPVPFRSVRGYAEKTKKCLTGFDVSPNRTSRVASKMAGAEPSSACAPGFVLADFAKSSMSFASLEAHPQAPKNPVLYESMHSDDTSSPPVDYTTKHLGDAVLMQRLRTLVARDRRVTAWMLAHLAEVDARGLHRDAGHSSMFRYCVEGLKMSEPEAALRIRAARLSRQFPRILPMVERGELHLSALRVLAPELDENNCERLLAAATHKSKREVEQLVADLAPKPAVAVSMRKLPSARPAAPSRPQLDLTPPEPTATPKPTPDPPARPQPHATRPALRPQLSPLGAERYRIQLTAERSLRDKLTQAQELLRHQVPDGDLATIMERAVDLLLQEQLKRRFAQTSRPCRTPRAVKAGSRHIPAEVRRAVSVRDGTQCTFVSADGRRCAETGLLEFHHDHPHALGGPPTVDNIRLLCRAHNALLAERDFGREKMARARRRCRSEIRGDGHLPLFAQVPGTHQV
jgi:hypothetical protein